MGEGREGEARSQITRQRESLTLYKSLLLSDVTYQCALNVVVSAIFSYRPVYEKSARELAREAMEEDMASSASQHKRITSRIYSESTRRVF
jgi:hypothetical protein